MGTMQWRNKIPRDPERETYGPVQPRIKRFRTREWSCVRPARMRNLARNGVTKAITADSSAYSAERFGYEYCDDTVPNPVYNLPRSDLLDDGGEFWLRRTYWTARHAPFSCSWIRNTRHHGELWCLTPGSMMDGLLNVVDAKAPPSEDGDIASFGPAGYARAKPAQPAFNFGQTLVELRELPQMLRQRLDKIRSLAGAYVGAEFGWRPLLNDIMSLIDLGARLEEKLQRLLQNNGKPVRGRSFVTQVDESSVFKTWPEGTVGISYNTWPWYDPVVPKPSTAGYLRVTKDYHRKVWFAGEFQYWLHDLSTPGRMLKLRAQLLGLEMTPKLLWDLIPWSWLVDWFSNVGDIVDNAVETIPERQVARYAYVMGHTTRRYTWSGSDGKHSAQASKMFETKRRVPADRFGLTVEQNLTVRQSFLLGMLGLSRVGA